MVFDILANYTSTIMQLLANNENVTLDGFCAQPTI